MINILTLVFEVGNSVLQDHGQTETIVATSAAMPERAATCQIHARCSRRNCIEFACPGQFVYFPSDFRGNSENRLNTLNTLRLSLLVQGERQPTFHRLSKTVWFLSVIQGAHPLPSDSCNAKHFFGAPQQLDWILCFPCHRPTHCQRHAKSGTAHQACRLAWPP